MAAMRRCVPVLAMLAALMLAGCSSSRFEPPDVHGVVAVDDGGKSRLWVLTKQEEVRQVGVGGGRRSSAAWRTDTFFHFDVQAFDPVAMRPLWRQRLATFGDPRASGATPSRVIGSSVEARLLGQEGEVVWLLIGAEPHALRAADGAVVADGAGLQERNPELKGLLPVEARHYGFDQGLVFMAADARRFVVRGPRQQAVEYTPPPPPAPQGELLANGTYRIVPMRPPLGPAPVRQALLGGQRIGLYSPKEVEDARTDDTGNHLRYPYTVLDEGAEARRTFWHVQTETVQRWDERIERIAALAPVPSSPTFLRGRFLADPVTETPLPLADPEGVVVWHSTRVDKAGRLALSRLDAQLRTQWTAPLPLSEAGIINPVDWWMLPGRLVVSGQLESEVDGVTLREPHLVSVDLGSGKLQAWNLEREAAVP